MMRLLVVVSSLFARVTCFLHFEYIRLRGIGEPESRDAIALVGFKAGERQ